MRSSQNRNGASQARNEPRSALAVLMWTQGFYTLGLTSKPHLMARRMRQSDVMKTNNTLNNQFESTYTLVVRSQEKGRGVLEVAVFVAFIVSIVFSIWQFAQTPVTTPAPGTKPCVACHITKSELRAGS